MSEFVRKYLKTISELISRIEKEEMASIEEGAKLMADAVQAGNRLFAFGCSHSSLPVQDLVYRAGGLMLINPIFGPGIAALDSKPTTIGSAMEQMPGYGKVILDNAPIQKGDVLIIVSVAGRNAVPVEIAQLAHERGIKVISLISREYSGSVTSRAPSGKMVFEFADLVLDNKAPKGDAILQDPRVPQKFTPVSGVTSIAVLQALVACTIETLLARGITPPVFLAANVDGGAEYNARLLKEYRNRIFYL
jgi:uncharacterized phosphosugar-binding protein